MKFIREEVQILINRMNEHPEDFYHIEGANPIPNPVNYWPDVYLGVYR